MTEEKNIEEESSKKKFADDAFFIRGKITSSKVNSCSDKTCFNLKIQYEKKDNGDYPELFQELPEYEDDYIPAFVDTEGTIDSRETNNFVCLAERYSTRHEEMAAEHLVGMKCLIYRRMNRIDLTDKGFEDFFDEELEEEVFIPIESLSQKMIEEKL